MSLAVGARIGPYEVTAKIGEGGMGQVYRARDTQLDREVAIKILPDAFVADSDRVARFQREARTLASLNHPHIAIVHGLEQDGGVYALVMELVAGEDLSQRIARGPIPLDEALPIVRQIAEALEAAHEQGIVHRDLKPANIKVKPDGTVKVLDFGLAKALGADQSSAAAGSASMSPTLTTPVLTGMGMVLGTAAYMAPEQARGKPVDKRADIWAFGAVFYEMLTGRRAFDDEDVSLTLSRVLQREPDWSALPPATPPAVTHVLRRCLQKDPRERLRDIGDAHAELKADAMAARAVAELVAPTGHHGAGSRRMLPVAAAALLVGGLLAGATTWRLMPRATPRAPVRSVVNVPDGSFENNPTGQPLIALSPDGRTLVYGGSGLRLYRRDLGGLTVQPIPGTDGTSINTPFFSPDGRWLGFTANDGGGVTIRKVALDGGPVASLTQAEVRGAAWGPGDTIVFGTADGGLFRVSANGGERIPVTTLEAGEVGHYRPEFLPGGQAVLFTIWSGGLDTAQIAVVSLATGERHALLAGTYPRYVPTGHIVFARSDALWAVPFDVKRHALTGPAFPVLEGVALSANNGVAQFAVADDGTLVYAPGNTTATGVVGTTGTVGLAWVGRDGRAEAIDAPPRLYSNPAISPDGTRVAVDIIDAQTQNVDVWIWHVARKTLTRLTFDPANDYVPLWTRDGAQIVFHSDREDGGLFSQRADGTGETARLADGPLFPMSWGPDGQLVFAHSTPTRSDIGVLAPAGTRPTELLLNSTFRESRPAVSPDGRWLAYEANETGRFEVYVRPFPDVNVGKWQVSTGGGSAPRWSPTGEELFFVSGPGYEYGSLMRVRVETSAGFATDRPSLVLKGSGYVFSGTQRYDVAPDGQRFLVRRLGDAGSPGPAGQDVVRQVVLIQNWFEELKARIP